MGPGGYKGAMGLGIQGIKGRRGPSGPSGKPGTPGRGEQTKNNDTIIGAPGSPGMKGMKVGQLVPVRPPARPPGWLHVYPLWLHVPCLAIQSPALLSVTEPTARQDAMDMHGQSSPLTEFIICASLVRPDWLRILMIATRRLLCYHHNDVLFTV